MKKAEEIVKGQSLVVADIMDQDGPPLAVVRADLLMPMLALMRKFFRSVESVSPHGISRFQEAEAFRMSVHTQGFTPEHFNALQSLNNSIGQQLAEDLDKAEASYPVLMSRPELVKAQRLAAETERRLLKEQAENEKRLADKKLLEERKDGKT